ncbi:MAG: glycosyltransferase family 4 protein [Candidatus Nealsonbacteria bacterium]|nr:glycosyltransferase family 4 protein [Candidatus Nealsonbacteria bacterium]
MRIGLVLEQFDPRRGGLECWTARFAEQLVHRGHEVHVVARQFNLGSDAVRVIAHPLPHARSRLGFAEAAEATLRTLPLDVIHDMGAGWYCDVFHPHGGSWDSITERKLLLHPPWLRPIKRRVDRLLPRHRQYRALLARQYADRGQVMVALSQAVADDFRRFHGVAPERIRVVYNGVDTDRFSPEHRGAYRQTVRDQLGVDDDALLALVVAHNFRLKGVPTALRAVGRLVAEGRKIHLAVVGGRRLQPWRRLARRLGIGGHVTLVGPTGAAVPYYAAADVYVHPTYYDTCSLVVLEAAAAGLPVITTRLNGVAELLDDGRDALLISDPADDRTLAERLRRLFDPDLRARLGSAARATALRHPFTGNVDQLLSLYHEITARRRAA